MLRTSCPFQFPHNQAETKEDTMSLIAAGIFFFYVLPVSSIAVSTIVSLIPEMEKGMWLVRFIEPHLMVLFGASMGMVASRGLIVANRPIGYVALNASAAISLVATYLVLCLVVPGDYLALSHPNIERLNVRVMVSSLGCAITAIAVICVRNIAAARRRPPQ